MLDPAAGQRLREYMEPRIGNVQPWAERHGIGRDTVYALWRGREPRADTLNRIADALGVTYEELLRVRAGVPEPPVNRRSTDPLIEQMAEMNRINAELVASLKQLVQTHVELQAARQEEWLVDQDQTLAEYVQRAATEQAPTKLPRPRVQPSEPRGR